MRLSRRVPIPKKVWGKFSCGVILLQYVQGVRKRVRYDASLLDTELVDAGLRADRFGNRGL